MKELFYDFVQSLDYRNEFTTKEAIVYTALAIVVFVVALCGESVILSIF